MVRVSFNLTWIAFFVVVLGLLVQLVLWMRERMHPYLILLTFLYLVWMVYDSNTPSRGGRPLSFLRNLPTWKILSGYFPCKLILQEQLDPSKTYIFASHPHGIMGCGLWSNIMNDSTNVSGLLKGINFRVITIDIIFKVPLYRDYGLGLGFISLSRRSCDYALSRGISLVVVVGAAEEGLDCQPGTTRLLIKKRKGFIKLALQHGAHLVPVFHFGETELYNQIPNPPGSRTRRFQNWLKEKYGFFATYFWGRAFLPIPMKHELVTIMGRPIEVKKKENFDENDVEELHKKYLEALTTLYNSYANKYAKGIKLEIV